MTIARSEPVTPWGCAFCNALFEEIEPGTLDQYADLHLRTHPETERARTVGDALQRVGQRIIFDDPDQAANTIVIGIDLLGSILTNKPNEIPGFRPWVELIAGVFDYITAGDPDNPPLIVRDLIDGYLPGQR